MPTTTTITVPPWIDAEHFTADVLNCPTYFHGEQVADLRAIVQGGCSSGAYMPAVNYYEARATMAEHGDAVVEYLYDNDALTSPVDGVETFSALCVFLLSLAVEVWAYSTLSEIDPDSC